MSTLITSAAGSRGDQGCLWHDEVTSITSTTLTTSTTSAVDYLDYLDATTRSFDGRDGSLDVTTRPRYTAPFRGWIDAVP